MLITKEQFINRINFIKNLEAKESMLCNTLEELSPGCYCDALIYSECINEFIKDLERELEDANLIDYKMYEFDNWPNNRKEEELKKYPELESWETVYDYLIAKMEAKNEKL